MTEGNNTINSDTMPLDTRIESEYDKDDKSIRSHSSPCHPRAQTRGSRNNDINSMNKDIYMIIFIPYC